MEGWKDGWKDDLETRPTLAADAGIVSFVILGLEKQCTEDAVLSDFAVSKFDALLVCLWLIVGTAQLAIAAHFVSRLGAGVTIRQIQGDDDFPLEVLL